MFLIMLVPVLGVLATAPSYAATVKSSAFMAAGLSGMVFYFLFMSLYFRRFSLPPWVVYSDTEYSELHLRTFLPSAQPPSQGTILISTWPYLPYAA